MRSGGSASARGMTQQAQPRWGDRGRSAGTPPGGSLNPAWVVLAACFFVLFGVWNSHAAFGVFLPVLSQEFGWSRGAISVAASIQLIAGGAIAFAIGGLSDRHGPRLILASSALMAGAVFLLTSGVATLWNFYLLQGLLLAVGMSSIYLVPTTTISRWFVDRRGLALGILLAGLHLAFITGPPLAAFLINRFGWRAAYALLAGIMWVIAIPASLFTRFPPGPSGSGAVGDGLSRRAPEHGADGIALEGATFREALVDRRLWHLVVAWLLLGFAWMMVVVHLVSHVKDRGVTLERASLALTIFGIGAIAGRLLFGVAADKLGTKSTFWFCQILQIVTLAWLLTNPPLWALYLLMLLFGMGAAGSDTAVVKAAVEVFGVRAIGATMGILSFGWRCGAALGPAAAGFMYDATGSYLVAFGLASGGLVVSFAFFTLGTPSLHHRGRL